MTGQIVARYLKISALLVAGWLIALVLFQTVGKRFIEIVYYETLPIAFLNDAIAGRHIHPLEFYLDAATTTFFRWSKLALRGGALLLALSCAIHVVIRSGKGRELLLAASAVLISLLLCEGVFRLLGLTGYHPPQTREASHAVLPDSERIAGVKIQFRPNSDMRICYENNPTGYFDADNCLTYQLNNFGFRDRDYSVAKRAGTLRVALLGDSFAFGEGVRLEDAFSRLLEKRLAAAGKDVDVLNFSIGGWGTRDQIAYLEAQGLAFAPDLVLVAYVLNDADYAGGLDVWEGFRQQYEKSWLRHSAILSFAYAAFAQRFYVKSYVEEMITRSLSQENKWAVSFAELERGRQLAEAQGANFAVAILPFMYDLDADHAFLPIHRMIADFCRSKGIPVRDLLPAFLGKRYTEMWVHPSDPHPNREGHRVIAKALADFILDEGLLKGQGKASQTR